MMIDSFREPASPPLSAFLLVAFRRGLRQVKKPAPARRAPPQAKKGELVHYMYELTCT